MFLSTWANIRVILGLNRDAGKENRDALGQR